MWFGIYYDQLLSAVTIIIFTLIIIISVIVISLLLVVLLILVHNAPSIHARFLLLGYYELFQHL